MQGCLDVPVNKGNRDAPLLRNLGCSLHLSTRLYTYGVAQLLFSPCSEKGKEKSLEAYFLYHFQAESPALFLFIAEEEMEPLLVQFQSDDAWIEALYCLRHFPNRLLCDVGRADEVEVLVVHGALEERGRYIRIRENAAAGIRTRVLTFRQSYGRVMSYH